MRRRLANLCTIYPYELSIHVPENLDADQTIMLLEDAFQTPYYNRLNEALYRELQ